MNAIKKRLQTLKVEKDLAMDKADTCDQQAKEANRKAEMLKDEVRDLAKKLYQMEHDYEVSTTQLAKSNVDLETTERDYLVVSRTSNTTFKIIILLFLILQYDVLCSRLNRSWRY